MSLLLKSEREIMEYDLARLRAALRRGRWAGLLAFAVLVLTGLAWAILAKRTYDATAIVVATDVSPTTLGLVGPLASLAASVGVGGGSGQSMVRNEVIAMLTTRSFVGKFIADKELKPKLFSGDWDQKKSEWRTGWPHAPPTDFDAYEKFTSDVLNIQDDLLTGLIKIRIRWSDPVEGAALVNELVDRANMEMRRRVTSDSDAILSFLEAELRSTSLVPVQQSIFKLMETHLNTKAVVNVREEYALRYVDRALPKDAENYDHPRILLLVPFLIVVAPFLALMVALAWGATRPRQRG